VNVALAQKVQRGQSWNPRVLERVVFATGHNIFTEGMRGRRAFVVERGAVSIWTGNSGRSLELERLGPCCIFGELALIVDDAPRSATATAMMETTCLIIKDYEFRRKLDGADAFVRALVRILAENIRETNRHVFSLAEPREDRRL
jgi:CRP-like cAMP-binding protein